MILLKILLILIIVTWILEAMLFLGALAVFSFIFRKDDKE